MTADVSSARLAVVTGRTHVLVVEDEVEPLGLVESLLVAAGFKVTACSDPAAALEQVLKGSPPPDLLLSDMRMPGMGGHALLAKVRERLPEIRAGFMSGFAHAEGSGEGLAIEVLQKPFSQGQLLAYVEEQLGRAAPLES